MRKSILILGISLIFTNFCSAGEVEDPFAQVTREKLANGIYLVLAPNEKASTFRMKVRVDAGFASETEATSGVSHLLEHYLFTDARLQGDMSYLELIREKGGSANGQTSEMETTYFATVPAAESRWLSKLFYSMLFRRNFDAQTLEQVKKPVLLEIGKPEPLAWLLDSWIMKAVNPKFLRVPDFWKSEFEIEHERFSHAHESLNTIRMNVSEVEKYYRDYYHPGNITLFVAGKFDRASTRREIIETFGKVQEWSGKTLSEDPPAVRRGRYVRSESTSGTPFISLGTKVSGLSTEDETVLRVYLEDLAHRLMKEMRNKHGDTYSVRPIVSLRENFGYGSITLEAPSEKFQEYLKYIRGLIDHEARQGGVTEAQFKDAMSLYSSHFKLADRDSGTQLRLAEIVDRLATVFHKDTSPYQVYRAQTYGDYRERLHKLFDPKQELSMLHEPPVLGRLENYFVVFASIVFFLLIARRVFASPFVHAELRWVRKLSHPPAYVAEGAFLGLGILLSSYLDQWTSLQFLKSEWIQSSFVFSSYLKQFVGWGFAIYGCIFCCSFLVRKAMVCGDQLYLKSMTYTSRRIPIREIESVTTMSLFQFLLSPRTTWSTKWRIQFWNPLFWQKGVLIRLKNGTSYFVGIRKSSLAAAELERFVHSPIQVQDQPKAA